MTWRDIGIELHVLCDKVRLNLHLSPFSFYGRNQAEMDDLDSWLKFMRKPLPLRMLAPVMMKRLNIRLKFLEDYTKVHFCRDFSAGPTIFDVIVTVNDPEFVTFKDDATSGYNHLKISIDEDKKTCTMTMKQDGNPDTFAVRKMLDKNTMESVSISIYFYMTPTLINRNR